MDINSGLTLAVSIVIPLVIWFCTQHSNKNADKKKELSEIAKDLYGSLSAYQKLLINQYKSILTNVDTIGGSNWEGRHIATRTKYHELTEKFKLNANKVPQVIDDFKQVKLKTDRILQLPVVTYADKEDIDFDGLISIIDKMCDKLLKLI